MTYKQKFIGILFLMIAFVLLASSIATTANLRLTAVDETTASLVVEESSGTDPISARYLLDDQGQEMAGRHVAEAKTTELYKWHHPNFPSGKLSIKGYAWSD